MERYLFSTGEESVVLRRAPYCVDLLGGCYGIRLTPRHLPNDRVVMFTLLVEDDGNWFRASGTTNKDDGNALWLRDIRNQIDRALRLMEIDPEFERGTTGEWKFKEIK